MKRILISTIVLCTAALPAGAAIESIGKGKALDCYVAAHTHEAPDFGIPLCDKALTEERLDNGDRASTLVNRGVLEFAKGQNPQAMADFNAAIALVPDEGDAYINRGVSHLALHHFAEALDDINKGIGLHPNHPNLGYYDRALVEETLGQSREAVQDYQHALQLEPDFTPASDKLKKLSAAPAKIPG